jgi:hypothetical protein
VDQILKQTAANEDHQAAETLLKTKKMHLSNSNNNMKQFKELETLSDSVFGSNPKVLEAIMMRWSARLEQVSYKE